MPRLFPCTRVHAQVLLLCLALLLALPLPAVAQGIIVDPPLPPGPPAVFGPRPLDVESHTVEAVIRGPVATVTVEQTFRNTTDRTVEGVYVFPLPPGVAVGDFQMTVDGRALEGKVLTQEEARRTYEEIVRRRRDPALLEYLDRNLFQARIFPIPPGATRRIRLTYRQVLRLENGLYRFTYPLGGDRSHPPQSFALSVDLQEQPGLRTIYSPSHDVAIQRSGDDAARIGLETEKPEAMRDFTLYFGSDAGELGVNLLSYKPVDEQGFLLLLAAPRVEAAAAEIVERDVVVVVDVSGSMEGTKLEQARDAVRFVVEHLNAGDRFALLSFSTGVDRWRGELVEATAENRAAAAPWIDGLRATGSTDINRALLEALALLEAGSKRPAYVLFLTDGLPTMGEEDPWRIVANVEDNRPVERSLRLFTFGVGYDVNTDLLDTLSERLGGRSRYVRPDERIDEAVSAFYAGISTPVLADIAIAVEGATIDDTYPFPLPDLFAGGQLLWAGRYDTGGPVTVEVRGTVNGEERVFRYVDLHLVESGGDAAVARLWATRKIGALLAEARRNGARDEIVDAIVDLSLRYGIVTPYTSFLVEEPQVAGQVQATPQPRSLRSYALPAAAARVQAVADADAVGEGAVAASAVRSQLRYAERAEERREVRFVAGKTFTHQGPVTTADGAVYPLWVDTAYEAEMNPRTVVFGSDAYFALAADPEAARWLALSPEMLVVVDGEALRITVDGVQSEPISAEGAASAPAETPTPWARFLKLILGWFGR